MGKVPVIGNEMNGQQGGSLNHNMNSTKNHNDDSYEGRQQHIPTLDTPAIDVFENVYAGKDYLVKLDIPEFTAICPKTGLPDFGIIEIEYRPAKFCLELKSLKEYFGFYRNLGIFHENVVNKAFEDIVKACHPNALKVKAVYNVRGGITTTVEREFVA